MYKNIEGPNLWPNPEVIPKFRPTIERFIEKLTALSNVFKDLVAESIGVDPKALNRYFKENQQCKMKLIAYPDVSELDGTKSAALDDTPETNQGVGPHRDSDLITYIY